jgi:hypothetical protein
MGCTVFYSERQCDLTFSMALCRLEINIKIIFIENSIPKTTLIKVASGSNFFEGEKKQNETKVTMTGLKTMIGMKTGQTYA